MRRHTARAAAGVRTLGRSLDNWTLYAFNAQPNPHRYTGPARGLAAERVTR